MGTDTTQVAMQVIGSSPQIGAGYNIAPMFSYIMKTQGADLKAFEKSPEQVAYESAVQSWQQTAMEVAKAGGDLKSLPQPTPQQFGYDPKQQGSNSASTPTPVVATKINNITNNITNAEQQ
jgi:hypothetical protein